MQDQVYVAPVSRAARLPRVCEILGISPATAWRWAKFDRSFPRPFHLSPGITAWDEGEVIGWLEAKKAERGAA